MIDRRLFCLLACLAVVGQASAHRNRVHKKIKIPVTIGVTVHVAPRKAGKVGVPKKQKRVERMDTFHQKQEERMANFRQRQAERMAAFQRRQKQLQAAPASSSVTNIDQSTVNILQAKLAQAEARMDRMDKQLQLIPSRSITQDDIAKFLEAARLLDKAREQLMKDQQNNRAYDPTTSKILSDFNKNVILLQEQLKQSKADASSKAALAQAAADQIHDLKAALNAYLLSEQQLLADYETYRESPYQPFMKDASPILDQLAKSWQVYKDSVQALNVVLIHAGISNRVPVNQDYELLVTAALGRPGVRV